MANIEIPQALVVRALTLYRDFLSQKFLYQPLTPAMLVRMNLELKELQLIKQQQESHPVWRIPVEAVVGNNSHQVEVVLTIS